MPCVALAPSVMRRDQSKNTQEECKNFSAGPSTTISRRILVTFVLCNACRHGICLFSSVDGLGAPELVKRRKPLVQHSTQCCDVVISWTVSVVIGLKMSRDLLSRVRKLSVGRYLWSGKRRS